MNQYTLDYSNPHSDGQSANRRFARRPGQSFRQAVLLISALIWGIVFVAAIRMRADAQLHQTKYQTQAIRYDSLLAAKDEADRQIRQLRSALTSVSSNP